MQKSSAARYATFLISSRVTLIGKLKKTTSNQLLLKLSSRLLCNPGALLCVFLYTALRQSLWLDHSVISPTYSTNQKPVSGFPNFFGPIKSQSARFPNFDDQSKFQGPTKMSPSSVCNLQRSCQN